MCDYGIGKNLSSIELKEALEKTLLPALPGIKTVLFGSYGSIFDEYEISDECLEVILDFVLGCNFENIIFETHYSTVTSEKLGKIKNAVGDKFEITIEMGYESCDSYILSNCLRKVMDLEELKKAITLIHNEGMRVSLNVFLGAPFITVQDQTLTTVESLRWAFLNGADDIVLFPSNIKPFTLLYNLYKSGYYSEVSHWQIIDVLNRIPVEYLNKVSLSWFGDRRNFYENDKYPLIPPKDCAKCHEKIFNFYRNFRNLNSGSMRKKLLNDFLALDIECSCRSEYMSSYDKGGDRFSPELIEGIVGSIEEVSKSNSINYK